MSDRMRKIIAAGEADAEAYRAEERAAVVAWLFEDAAQTRDDLSRLHKGKKLTAAQTQEWETLIAMKVGIARCIQRGHHLKERHS